MSLSAGQQAILRSLLNDYTLHMSVYIGGPAWLSGDADMPTQTVEEHDVRVLQVGEYISMDQFMGETMRFALNHKGHAALRALEQEAGG